MEVSTLTDYMEGPSSPLQGPYSVAKYRMQRQLEAAAEATNPEVLIRRLTHAIKTANDAGNSIDVSLYQEELGAIQNQLALTKEQGRVGLLPLIQVGAQSPLKFITPRQLPATPAEVRARIEAGEASSLVAMLTLNDAGLAELRDASDPSRGVVRSVQVFDPSVVNAEVQHLVLRRGSDAFDHLALRDMLEDATLPFARVVAVIDPMYAGSQLLASQLLRHGPQMPLNSIICALPSQTTEGDLAGPEYLPLVVSLCLGGDEVGTGRHTSGFVFGRALAIVERATANEGSWPDSVAPLALQVASLGTEVEERPNCTGQWLFHPPAPEVVEEAPPPAPEAPADGEGEEGGEGEPPPAAEAAPEGEDGEEGEKPPEPEKATYTGTNVHAWLFNGLNQCYASETCVSKLVGDGLSEADVRGGKEWLAKTEKAGFWGPVVGVRAETVRIQEEEREAKAEAKREAKRQAKAEKKRLVDEAAAAEAAAAEAAEAAAAEAAAAEAAVLSDAVAEE